MLRPEAYQQPHLTIQNVPYFAAENSSRGTMPVGGVLGRGQVVWTREAFATQPAPHTALAFVEELGIVSLDPRWLVRTALAER